MTQEYDFRDFRALKKEKFNDDNFPTITSIEQRSTETAIEKCFDRFQQIQALNGVTAKFYRDEHCRYLTKYIERLPQSYECLDCSRPWNVYWILNAASCLNHTFPENIQNNIINFLIKCRNPNGGFAGGPGQYPHLAPTYAAVNSLCIIGTKKAYDAIDKESLINFLWSVRVPDGSFQMHVDGEVDVRGAYCAISCAKLVNISEETEKELFKGTADWVASCQTYEGGFGGAPDLEAHGGYAFCGIASLVMLGGTHLINSEMFLRWSLARQMRFEGGFQGRTNKLVDGCYSFWVGACIPIIQAIIAKEDIYNAHLMRKPFFDRGALQEYILLCCQKPSGGLIDKPGKPQDLYHTCYTLSGVSISQHCENSMSPLVIGCLSNELLPVHPIHNIPPMAVVKAYMYFNQLNNGKNQPAQEPSNDGGRTSSSREASSEATTTTTTSSMSEELSSSFDGGVSISN